MAVRVQSEGLSISDPENEAEDESEIDGFLSSIGFEFVDATGESPPPRKRDEEDSYEEGELVSELLKSRLIVIVTGIPHLPRVLDALSTIMWPSMQTQTRSSMKNAPGLSTQGSGLLDWVDEAHSHSLGSVDIAATPANARNIRQEMEELAQWLEKDERPQQDPWETAATTGAMSTSPTTLEAGPFPDTMISQKPASLKFDDDFTVFVSAPPQESGTITPVHIEADALQPPHAQELYRSLGSVSDLGDTEEPRDVEVEDKVESEDESLPSREEIRETSMRIFGATASSSSRVDFPGPELISPSKTLRPFEETFAFNAESDQGENDADYNLAKFDLAQVLSALQGMKAEISTMDNEAERRKAAARVALGLVYGLEADSGLDVEAELQQVL